MSPQTTASPLSPDPYFTHIVPAPSAPLWTLRRTRKRPLAGARRILALYRQTFWCAPNARVKRYSASTMALSI
ncbi:unnamed protein product, partial [Iphiclides podalirius]